MFNKKVLGTLIKNAVRLHCDRLYCITKFPDEYKCLTDYMNITEESKQYYQNANEELLTAKLTEEIEDIVREIGNENFSFDEKILNFLEYFRLNVMYESIGEKASKISQSALNPVILGKGVCNAQAHFLELLLLESGEEAAAMRVKLKDQDTGFVAEHKVAIVKSPNQDIIYYLDPTWYNGTSSFNTERLSDDMLYGSQAKEFHTFESDISKISQARKRVYEYLIKKYKIKEISHLLDLDGLSDLEKHARIIMYMSRHLVKISETVRARSILLEGKEIEIGKALELFYYANGIEFSLAIKKNSSKRDAILLIWIDGKSAAIYPKKVFSLSENNSLISKKWIAIQKEDGNFQTIDQLNEYDSEIMKKQEAIIDDIESKSKD